MLSVERDLDAVVADERGDEVPLRELMRAVAGEKQAGYALRLGECDHEFVPRSLPAFAEFTVNRQRGRVGAGEIFDLARLASRLAAIRGERNVSRNVFRGPNLKLVESESARLSISRIASFDDQPDVACLDRCEAFLCPVAARLRSRPRLRQLEFGSLGSRIEHLLQCVALAREPRLFRFERFCFLGV